jgi:hypothetical protein
MPLPEHSVRKAEEIQKSFPPPSETTRQQEQRRAKLLKQQPRIKNVEFKPTDTLPDIFGLYKHDYVRPDHWQHFEEALAIAGFMGLEPVAYQLGHKFYNKAIKSMYLANTHKTLDVSMLYLGTRVLWVPPLEYMIEQMNRDGMRLSVWYGGSKKYNQYRTYIYDPLFEEEEGGVELVRYTSKDHFMAFIIPFGKAYKRRFDTFGIDTFKQTIYHKYSNTLPDEIEVQLDQV